MTNSWLEGPLLNTVKVTVPVATVVAVGRRNMSPAVTATPEESACFCGAGFCAEAGACACGTGGPDERQEPHD
jgi:hypothetical protein